MLKGEIAQTYDLAEEKERYANLLNGELKKYIDPDNCVTTIYYPLTSPPTKVSQIGFDDNATIGGKLAGIKGQYLIFDDGKVLNIRKHNGYFTEFDILG